MYRQMLMYPTAHFMYVITKEKNQVSHSLSIVSEIEV